MLNENENARGYLLLVDLPLLESSQLLASRGHDSIGRRDVGLALLTECCFSCLHHMLWELEARCRFYTPVVVCDLLLEYLAVVLHGLRLVLFSRRGRLVCLHGLRGGKEVCVAIGESVGVRHRGLCPGGRSLRLRALLFCVTDVLECIIENLLKCLRVCLKYAAPAFCSQNHSLVNRSVARVRARKRP